jgi:hypothetical protein
MKPLLVVLLALSVIGNAVLGYQALRRTAPAPAASTAAPSTAPARTAARAAEPAAATASTTTTRAAERPAAHWGALNPKGDLRELVSNLRQAGFPPSVMRAVVREMINDRYAANDPDSNEPFWRRVERTPESVAASQAIERERRDLFEALLGADARPSATMNATERERRYGNLSDEKLDAVAMIERDYSEIRSMASAQRTSNAAARGEEMMNQQRTLEAEKRADLAAILTPDELAQYDMRNSSSASRVMSNLRGLDVTEAEYAALFQAQQAHDAVSQPLFGRVTPEMIAQRQAAQDALNAQARRVLADDRFYKYLESSDPNYAQVARFSAEHPSVSRDTTYQLYQIQRELQTAMMSLSRNAGPMDAANVQQRMLEMQAMAASYESRVQSLLGPELTAAYKQTPQGRMFSIGSGRASSGSAPSGAVIGGSSRPPGG